MNRKHDYRPRGCTVGHEEGFERLSEGERGANNHDHVAIFSIAATPAASHTASSGEWVEMNAVRMTRDISTLHEARS